MMSDENRINKKGEEIPDPTPVAVPVKYTRPPSRYEELRAMVFKASQELGDKGFETVEDADDFDVGDDYDPTSPYELQFDPGLNKEVTKEEKRFLDSERARASEEIKAYKSKAKVKKKEEFQQEEPGSDE